MTTPTLINRIKTWIIVHILRMDSPTLIQAAIYLSPLYEPVCDAMYERHEAIFQVKYSETTPREFNIELSMEESK